MTAARPLAAVPNDDTDADLEAQAVDLDRELHLIAAAVRATPAAIMACPILATDLYRPTDGMVWDQIGTLAAAGITPDLVTVKARIERAGNLGDRLQRRLLDVVTCQALPEQLPIYAQTVLSATYRREVVSYGLAVAAAGEEMAEAELWPVIEGGGRRLRAIIQRIENLNIGDPQ